jgi:cell division protein FtsZ
VVLGAPLDRYTNISKVLNKPAYQARNSKFIVQSAGSRKEKEVLRDEQAEVATEQEGEKSASLF